jgi:hypothetical protein
MSGRRALVVAAVLAGLAALAHVFLDLPELADYRPPAPDNG